MPKGGDEVGGAKSKSAQIATKATSIENMNEAQLKKEIAKEKKKIARYKQQRGDMSDSAEEKAMREAFPLGTGGLSTSQAQKKAGEMAEKALNRSKKLSEIISKQESAERRLQQLEQTQKKIKGTGKTAKQIDSEKKKASTAKSTRKWTTTQKEQFNGESLVPRVIKSGDYEIVGKSVLRIYKNGKQIGTTRNLKDAKSFVEKYDSK